MILMTNGGLLNTGGLLKQRCTSLTNKYYLMMTSSSGREWITKGPFNSLAEVDEARWNMPDEQYHYLSVMTEQLAKEKYDYPK